MMWIKAKRVIRAGFINFWRNGWVSLATILVMVITLFVVGSLIFGKALLTASLAQLQDKVDITVYFKGGAKEEEIISLKDELSRLNEVKSIHYISAEKALEDFRLRHINNALITQSLEELGENPLGASLNIKAKNPNQYENITQFLEASMISSIDKINYHQNKMVIERLSNILNASEQVGIGITIVLSVIAILVAFNTIRLAIYTSRDEITVMRLVGASSRYIRGPFIVEGVMHGFLAAVITMIIFYPLTLWLGSSAEKFFGGLNLFNYYISNFGQIFLILLLVGSSLGAFSSFIAARRYLKV
jgi:cell division transport system permease protein